MALPDILCRAAYRLPSGPNAGAIRPALVVRIVSNGPNPGADTSVADLFVFGISADGAPFTNGPAYVLGVPRAQQNLPQGTWRML